MVAYLRRAGGRTSPSYDKSLLAADDPPLGQRDGVPHRLHARARPARGARRRRRDEELRLERQSWGDCKTTARDQAFFMRTLQHYVPDRHWDYARNLLTSITPSQRWGIGQVPLHGWHLHFKGGWGSGTGWVDHQVVLPRQGRAPDRVGGHDRARPVARVREGHAGGRLSDSPARPAALARRRSSGPDTAPQSPMPMIARIRIAKKTRIVRPSSKRTTRVIPAKRIRKTRTPKRIARARIEVHSRIPASAARLALL